MRLKSRLLSLFLVVVMLLGSTPIPTLGSGIIRVTIDGVPLSLDVPPAVMSGRTLVPLRAIFEALGASVTWDDTTQRISGARGSRTIVLYLGRNVAYIDGTAVALDVAPTAVRGRTMVPARFVAESLGATVSWNEATLTVEITRAIPVASLSLNLANLALVVTGGPAQLTATALPPNATDQRLNWHSSDPSVATVSPTGLVTPIAPGRARITVTSADGGRVATSEVTVAAPVVSVTGITLSHASHTLRIGETLRLVATITPPNATTRTVSWLSTNPDVASVTAEGLVTAHRVGTARITATSTDGGRVATCEVTVTAPVQAGAFSLTLTSVGTTSGSGNHPQGAAVQVTTTVPTGQTFVSWTNGAQVVSTSPSFSFTMPGINTTLVANFSPNRIHALEAAFAEKARRIQELQSAIAEQARRIEALVAALKDFAVGKRVIGAVDPYSPSIDLAALGIPIAMVDAFKLEKKGDQTGIPLVFTLADNRVFIGRTGTAEERVIYGWNTRFIGFAGGSNILELYQEYLLKVYTIAGQTYRISFKTSGLPALANDSTARQIILIPAMPEKGFYWPYLLAIPDTSNRASNVRHRRYLLVDGNNTGATNRFPETIAATKRFVSNRGFKAVRTADALWSPLLVPVFPRPKVGYSFWGEHNIILTHSFDRDTAILHLKMQDPNLRPMLIREFADANFNVHHLERLDLQLIAMIDHALEYLNKHQFNLEPAKVFMYGYSASGTFVDRFATLHPERVRAVSSGATLDDMILPLAQYRGRNLIFPIGVYDYERITGRQFSLARHNQVARLIHMGELDTFNVLPYGDCYGDHERQIITELWGVEILPRARKLIELYGQSGGKGMFILDRGQGHSESHAMQEYIIEFFKANRDSDVPVYPLPRDPAQLMYTLFR